MRIAIVGGDKRIRQNEWPDGYSMSFFESQKHRPRAARDFQAAHASAPFDGIVILTKWIDHSLSKVAKRLGGVFWKGGRNGLVEALPTMFPLPAAKTNVEPPEAATENEEMMPNRIGVPGDFEAPPALAVAAASGEKKTPEMTFGGKFVWTADEVSALLAAADAANGDVDGFLSLVVDKPLAEGQPVREVTTLKTRLKLMYPALNERQRETMRALRRRLGESGGGNPVGGERKHTADKWSDEAVGALLAAAQYACGDVEVFRDRMASEALISARTFEAAYNKLYALKVGGGETSAVTETRKAMHRDIERRAKDKMGPKKPAAPLAAPPQERTTPAARWWLDADVASLVSTARKANGDVDVFRGEIAQSALLARRSLDACWYKLYRLSKSGGAEDPRVEATRKALYRSSASNSRQVAEREVAEREVTTPSAPAREARWIVSHFGKYDIFGTRDAALAEYVRIKQAGGSEPRLWREVAVAVEVKMTATVIE